MIFQNKMKSELKAADGVIARHVKVLQAISRGVDTLTAAVNERTSAERALRDARARQLVDGAGPAETVSAQAAVDKAQAAIDRISEDLRALRGSLPRSAPELGQRYAAVQRELAAHNAAMIADFRREWEQAAAAYSAVLTKRAVIEGLTGESLADLPHAAPVPNGAADNDELSRPKRTLEALKSHLEGLAGSAPSRASLRVPVRPFDASKVYVLRKALRDQFGLSLPAGTLVIEASLERGMLDYLCAVDSAYPLEEIESGTEARREVLAIEQLQREERVQAETRNAEAARRPEPPVEASPVPFMPAPPTVRPAEYSGRTNTVVNRF